LVPLESETLQQRAYGQLREALMSGRFRPGEAITLRAAAAALGVSLMPVRGALQRLEVEGALVSRDRNRTLCVPELTATKLFELRDIRIALEGLAAEHAAANITPKELAKAEAHCAAMQAAADQGDRDAYVMANWSFHTAVYRASRMSRLLATIEGLWLSIGPYVPAMMPTRASLVASMPNHWAVVGALRDHDSASARLGIAADIAESAEHLRSILPA
jgi:DNA-binding GntR family transcriptional regulator